MTDRNDIPDAVSRLYDTAAAFVAHIYQPPITLYLFSFKSCDDACIKEQLI